MSIRPQALNESSKGQIRETGINTRKKIDKEINQEEIYVVSDFEIDEEDIDESIPDEFSESSNEIKQRHNNDSTGFERLVFIKNSKHSNIILNEHPQRAKQKILEEAEDELTVEEINDGEDLFPEMKSIEEVEEYDQSNQFIYQKNKYNNHIINPELEAYLKEEKPSEIKENK